jgi:CRP-like cAMP-binding protein
MSSSEGLFTRIDNRLLAVLPHDEYERLLPKLEPVRLPKHRILFKAGDPIRGAYFINSGMASLLAIENGETIEIGSVGREGFIGAPIVPRGGVAPYRAMTQTQTDAYRVDAEVLVAEFNRGDKLNELILLYSRVLETQLTQAVICNLFHNIPQRLSRYLLVTSDSLLSESFDLTQETIANMLGKDRNQVGTAASEMQKKGWIEYRRGSITLLDRKRLEASACECYRIVKESIAVLFK